MSRISVSCINGFELESDSWIGWRKIYAYVLHVRETIVGSWYERKTAVPFVATPTNARMSSRSSGSHRSYGGDGPYACPLHELSRPLGARDTPGHARDDTWFLAIDLSTSWHSIACCRLERSGLTERTRKRWGWPGTTSVAPLSFVWH